MNSRILLVAGARPNFIKIAPIIRALEGRPVEVRFVHTGQHYDRKMSGAFLDELNIPPPDVNLEVGSGSHVEQISLVMQRLDTDFRNWRPDIVVVVGDVNSTLAATLTGVKNEIPVAHVEAGLRSFDSAMPEEVNRVLVDSMSTWLFASEPAGVTNLRREGVADDKVHLVGNVMIDTLLAHLDAIRARRAFERFGVARDEYALVTLHRPSNVDAPERLEPIMRALHDLNGQLPVLFPMHPRTLKQVRAFGYDERSDCNGYCQLEPLGYLDMLSLVDGARLVITDSGGVQEETTALCVPCMTIRDNTERPITIDEGSNELVSCTHANIVEHAQRKLLGPQRVGARPALWDGNAASRIADVLTTTDVSQGGS